MLSSETKKAGEQNATGLMLRENGLLTYPLASLSVTPSGFNDDAWISRKNRDVTISSKVSWLAWPANSLNHELASSRITKCIPTLTSVECLTDSSNAWTDEMLNKKYKITQDPERSWWYMGIKSNPRSICNSFSI